MIMKGSTLFMTNEDVKDAITYWFNEKVANYHGGPHPVKSVVAMPASDQFCLSVEFENAEKRQ